MKKAFFVLGVLALLAVSYIVLKPASDLFYEEEAQHDAKEELENTEPVSQVQAIESKEPPEQKQEIIQPEPLKVQQAELEEVTAVAIETASLEPKQPDYVKYVAPITEHARSINEEGKTTHEDLETIWSLLQYSMRVYKSMPVAADNQEFVSHLIGKNKKGVQILAHDHPAINEEGMLVDRWGTPYFFHPMSEKLVELRSAGPDGILFNEDDITL